MRALLLLGKSAFIAIFFVFSFIVPASAEPHSCEEGLVEDSFFAVDKIYEKTGNYEQKVLSVSYNLLNKNHYQDRVIFQVERYSKIPNAFAVWRFDAVFLTKRLFYYMDNDDELAAVLAHEIGHIDISNKENILQKVVYHLYNSLGNAVLLNYPSRRQEEKADRIGVDLMVKADYNPLAAISILNKTAVEDYYPFLRTHPRGSKRLVKIYDYIEENYPEYIESGYDSPAYQNFLILKDKARKDNLLRWIGF